MCSCCPTAALLTMRRAMRPQSERRPLARARLGSNGHGGPFVVAAGLGEIGGEERAGVCCSAVTVPETGTRWTWTSKTDRNVETRGRGSLPSPSSGGDGSVDEGDPPSAAATTTPGRVGGTRPGWRKKAAHAAVRTTRAVRPTGADGPRGPRRRHRPQRADPPDARAEWSVGRGRAGGANRRLRMVGELGRLATIRQPMTRARGSRRRRRRG